MKYFPEIEVEMRQRPVGVLCGKIQYNSFREAQEVINYAKNHRRYFRGKRVNRKIGKKDIRPQRSYKCEVCGFWHLTSQPE